jgi:hypothetical protein
VAYAGHHNTKIGEWSGREAGTDRIIDDVLEAVDRRDWSRVKLLLHPYLHWREPGVTIRGRTKVLARLAEGPAPAPPNSYELRDGQVYRWTV